MGDGTRIFTPEFWRARIDTAEARGEPHRAVFRTTLDKWGDIEAAHRHILAEHVTERTSIIDVGCGYGRLLTLLPEKWIGAYHGVDLSPDFVAAAREKHRRLFEVHDFRDRLPVHSSVRYNLAVCCSVRGMVVREAGQDVWGVMEANIRKVAGKILYLEYTQPQDYTLE
jgi:SAM-dependent methyltransferase